LLVRVCLVRALSFKMDCRVLNMAYFSVIFIRFQTIII
jgi:hypothetical protein